MNRSRDEQRLGWCLDCMVILYGAAGAGEPSVHSATVRRSVVVSWSRIGNRDRGLVMRLTMAVGIDANIRQTEFEATWPRVYLIVFILM